MAKYKTEKRKANVGERILITNAGTTMGDYANGDIFTVKARNSSSVRALEKLANGQYRVYINDEEYEVIVEQPKPTKNARISALETEVAELRSEVEALKQAKKPKYTLDDLLAKYPTSNQRRADVIKRAKEFVNARSYIPEYTISFVENSEKRTVVALIRPDFDEVVIRKGIAKCDPDDVFNADIGKAIALARALGVEVPTEFVKAVQPTEVVVGHRFEITNKRWRTGDTGKVTKLAKQYNGFFHDIMSGYIRNDEAKITDDTDAVYE